MSAGQGSEKRALLLAVVSAWFVDCPQSDPVFALACCALCGASSSHTHSAADRPAQTPARETPTLASLLQIWCYVKVVDLQSHSQHPSPRSVRTPFLSSLACTLRQSSLLDSSTHSTPLLPTLINSLPNHLPISCLPLTYPDPPGKPSHRLYSSANRCPCLPTNPTHTRTNSTLLSHHRFTHPLLVTPLSRSPTSVPPSPLPKSPTHKQVWTSSQPCRIVTIAKSGLSQLYNAKEVCTKSRTPAESDRN